MRAKSRGSWKAMVLAAITLCAGVAQAAAVPGRMAPDTLGTDRDGTPHSLSEHRGKVVLLSFWASWCGYCLKELPIIENIQRKVGKEHVEVVALNVDKDHAKYLAMRRKLKRYELTLTTDDDRHAAEAYGVSGLPHLVLIDKEGRVGYIHIGYSEEQLPKFVDELNQLLVETPPAAAQSGAAP